MLKFVPLSLAACRSLPKTPLVAIFFPLISFLMPVFRLVVLWMMSGLLGEFCLICGQMRRPPIGGLASSNVMSGGASPSTTALVAVSADSLYSMSVCDLILHMWVWSWFASLAHLRSWSVWWSRSLCMWVFYDARSVVKFLIVLMHNELSVSMFR